METRKQKKKEEVAKIHRRTVQKISSWPRWSWWYDHPPRARHPGMWSQVTLGSIMTNKASGGDGIPAELFQILKHDAVNVPHSICQQIWKTQQWPQDWKRSVFIPIAKKGNAKERSNYHTIAVISHATKLMLKILQARLQKNTNRECPDVQAGFRKGRGTRDQIANISWIIKKAREFQKNIYFCFVDYAKAFRLCRSQQTVENSERDGNIIPPYPPPEKCRSRGNR